MTEQEMLKAAAADYSLSLIEDDMIIGLGTGSTVKYFLQGMAERIESGQLKNIKGIPSSRQTEKIAKDLCIPLTTFEEYDTIDITVDGADEVDPNLNLIKGGGGAMLREKVIAQASKRFVIIIDKTKYSDKLGTLFFVPVEVLPYALPIELSYLNTLGAKIKIRKLKSGEYYKTDQDNFILDCHFGPIDDPENLSLALNLRAGIMAHGLFLSLANDVIMADGIEVRHLTRNE